MKFISPSAEWWPQDTSLAQHIARVGRICYKAQGRQPSPDLSPEEVRDYIEERDIARCRDFWKSGHRSMFRHGTAYYFVEHENELPPRLLTQIGASPYIHHVVHHNHVWISANMQYLLDNERVMDILSPYAVTEVSFIFYAHEYNCDEALRLLRMTIVVTTQISTSRELNRTSPNAIAEQSTRYVDMKKKDGVQICTPHWFDDDGVTTPPSSSLSPFKHFLARLVFRISCKITEWSYHLLLRLGLKAQDARGVLPLDTYTIVAYTYNINEWQHILDLRYHGTTGAPHPNAKIIGEQINDIITQRMEKFKL